MEDLVPMRCNSIRGDDLFRAGDRFALLHARSSSAKVRLLREREERMLSTKHTGAAR